MINAGDIETATSRMGCRVDTKENLLKNFTKTLLKKLESREKKIKSSEKKLQSNEEVKASVELQELHRNTIKEAKEEIRSIKTKLV